MSTTSVEENKAINTQLVLNHLNLNDDVMNVVKSFAFYDKDEYYQIKLYKKNKDIVMGRIKNEMIKTGHENGNRGEWHWCVYFACSQSDGRDMSIQLQSTTCMTCGKYIFVGSAILHEQIQNNPRLVCLDKNTTTYMNK
jgi:hypothetical protein